MLKVPHDLGGGAQYGGGVGDCQPDCDPQRQHSSLLR